MKWIYWVFILIVIVWIFYEDPIKEEELPSSIPELNTSFDNKTINQSEPPGNESVNQSEPTPPSQKSGTQTHITTKTGSAWT